MDNQIYSRIVKEAQKGLGLTATNPMVGAALVDANGDTISIAHHESFGESHAEANLLDQVESLPPESTLYSTLEPCLHPGKTSACLDKIARSSVEKVVYGLKDPSGAVAGRSISALRRLGFEVEGPVDDSRYGWLIRSYLYNRENNYPWIEAKSALSADGFIATEDGGSKWITGEGSRAHGHRLRSRVDAVMIGAETLRNDDPKLTDRVTDSDRQPRAIVVLRDVENLPTDRYLFLERPEDCILILPPSAQDTDKVVELLDREVKIQLADLHKNQFNWRQILPGLLRKNIGRVLVEGGGILIGSLQQRNLINEYHLFYSGNILGNGRIPFSGMKSISSVSKSNQPQLIETRMFDGDIYVRRLDVDLLSEQVNFERIKEEMDEDWIASC